MWTILHIFLILHLIIMIIVDGKVHPAMMHGFASTLPFAVTEHSESRLVMELRDTAYTRKYFPYGFRLVVEFVLEGDMLVQNFRVVNEDQKPVYYCLGAHPGFYCPIGLGEPAEDYGFFVADDETNDNASLYASTSVAYYSTPHSVC